MNQKMNFIEEIYLGFQIIIMIILLNMAFPIAGNGGESWTKVLSFAYVIFIILRIYRLFRSTEGLNKEEEKEYTQKEVLWTSMIEGVFLFVFLYFQKESAINLSVFVFGYVLIQSIRQQLDKKIYMIIIAMIMEAYLFLTTGRTRADIIAFVGDEAFILFIAGSISLVLNEIQKLQKENTYYIHELETTNDKLQTIASTDYLTGLYNHKTFYQTISNYQKDQNENVNSLCMALIDIDDFKQVNDTYGHLIGDDILSGLAEIMRKSTRGTDFLARYGGEEFVMLLPMSTLEEAEIICERLRQNVENHVFQTNGYSLTITVSIGLSRLEPLESSIIHDFIKHVDDQLYEAKGTGKNRMISTEFVE